MEKQTKHSPLRWLLGLLLCCVAFGAQAQTVKIEGYTSVGTYNGYPLFLIDSPQITVSSTSGSFYYIYIDDNQVAHNYSSYWDSYSLNISSYLDGKYHKLQLKRGSSDYGICYFTNIVEQVSIDGLNYYIDTTGIIATVIGSTDDIEEANIPATITKDGVEYTVKSINASAFVNHIKLHTVTIPESVTSIGGSAFKGCSALTTLNFNAINCESCGSSSSPAFPSTVANLTIGNEVTNIPKHFLSNSKIEKLTIPEAVTSIGGSAFSGCEALTTLDFNAINCTSCGSSREPAFPSNIPHLTLGEKVTTIPAYFLYSGSTIEKLMIPESVTSIGASAFSACNSLKGLEFRAINCISCGNNEYPAFPSTISNLTFGDKVTTIPPYFLYNGCKIKSLNIPSHITSIGSFAFRNSNVLKSLTLGAGLLTINKNAFYSNSSRKIAKVFWLGNTLPEGVENIPGTVNYVANDQYSFSNQIKYQFLSSKFTVDGIVYVPVSPADRTCDVVDCIYDESFTEIKITDKVVNKGIKMTVNDIQQYAFYNNTGISRIEISNKGNIGAAAFSFCYNLTDIIISNKGHIGNFAFYECKNLKNTTLESEIDGIAMKAFYNCSVLPEITIPNSVKSLGSSVFQGCVSLSSVCIGTAVSNLSPNTFSGCSSLEHITIPKNIASIGDNTFSGCTQLSDLTIEEGDDILILGSNGSMPLFNDCPLDEVYIGRKLSYGTAAEKGYSPFYRNTSLRTVEITDAETEIYDNEFYGCSNLKSLQIGNGVKKIGNRAFSGCSALDYFSAGCNVETIGNEAFSDCTGLTKFYSHSKLPPVCGEQALDDVNKWKCTLYVPKQSSDEYKGAPQWKEFFFIEESTDAGVGSVLVGNTSEMEVYDLQGRMVGTSLEGLKARIYIVKQGGTTSKVAVN